MTLMKPTRRKLLTNILVALAATVVMVWFYPHPESFRYEFQEGRPWNYAKLIAPFDIPVHADSVTIQAVRDSLDANFVPIYEMKSYLADSIAASLPQAWSVPALMLEQELTAIYAGGVTDSDTKALIDAGKLPKIRILEQNILSEISTDALLSPREAFLRLDSFMADSILHQYFLQTDIQNRLQPNCVINETETRRRYDYDYLTLTADRGVILQGQTIIDKGDFITGQDYTNLCTYEAMMAERNTQERQDVLLHWVSLFLYIGLIMAALLAYFHFLAPEIFGDSRKIFFIYALLTLFYLIAVGVEYFVSLGIYMVPMMIVPILVLVFFDGRSALAVLIALTLACAGLISFAPEFIYLQFCAACATVYSLRELSRRSQLLRTSFFVVFTYIVAYVALELLITGSLSSLDKTMFVFLVVNAALTSVAYVFMFLIEKLFGFMSVVTLVELADINNPLLSRLSNECPGTFQHAVAVSNLASDAASKIGANVQLIRAGALYHDIGKLSNPAFFTENQHGVNPHDALPPERSAQIVIAHVTEGLKLADKAGLPSVIKNFISEHHGAGMAKYFYITACNKAGATVDPDAFRYPGPNPQSREASVLMMADAVEAAGRSLSDHNGDAITVLVNKIIDTQIADGLHNESNISFRDVATVKEAFIKRLMTIYHSRIAYPTATTAEHDADAKAQ